jgi:dipeptide/tripeptide permease
MTTSPHVKLLTLPVACLLAMEFFERMAYYATVFNFTSYSVTMLGYSVNEGNAVLQGFWALTPLSALTGSYFGDQRWGRRKTVGIFGVVYIAALGVIALSSSPLVFEPFPTQPTTAAQVLFLVGLFMMAMGYGGVKSNASSLVADTALGRIFENPSLRSFTSSYVESDDADGPTLKSRNVEEGGVQPCSNGCCGGHDGDKKESCGATEEVTLQFSPSKGVLAPVWDPVAPGRGEADAPNGGTLTSKPSDGECLLDSEAKAEMERALTSSLFRWYYWTFNCGALIGSMVSPFLLLLDPRVIPSRQNGNQVSGYYVANWCACGATVVGFVIFFLQYRRYQQTSAKANLLDFFKQLGVSIRGFCRKRCSRSLTSEEGPESEAEGLTSSSATGNATRLLSTQEINVKGTKTVLAVFSVLPFYWLVANQYAGNLVLQASWLNLPNDFQPELFSNVNTISSLVFLPILDRCILPRVVGNGKRASSVRRMILGCLACVVGLVWCGSLQVAILQRGSVDDNANYTLYPGQTMINAAWLLPPYILQGIASVLVDTTAIETGYLLAPKSMKSFVHALYLLCSSASGFLGLAISPVVLPSTFMYVFFGLALVLAVVAALFDRLVYPVEMAAVSALPRRK